MYSSYILHTILGLHISVHEIYMTDILVGKDELKAIRDDIDHLLLKGRQSFAIEAQRPIYESDDLNEKEQLVIEHINKNPSINKEKVASDLKSHYSRITILNTINGLLEKGLIISKQDKRGTYQLYINYQNIIAPIKEDLDVFKCYYFELLENAVPIAKNLLLKAKKDTKRFSKFYDLLTALIGPYKYLCIMYVMSDIFLWHKRPLDDDTLHRKYAIFFKAAKEIHAKLVNLWPVYSASELDSPVSEMLYSSAFGLYESHVLHMLKKFEEYGLSVWAERVIDVLWEISYPILPLIGLPYDEYLRTGVLDDWRKVLENYSRSNYKPRTQKLPFDH